MATLSGTVTDITGVHPARLVRAYHADGSLKAEVTSTAGTGAFSMTVPADSPYTIVALDAVYDPAAASTLALLNMNGADSGTVFTDQKGNTVTVTSAQTKTANKKYGSASAYFNGSARLSVPISGMSTFFQGSWTVEAWILTPPGATISGTVAWCGSRPLGYGIAFHLNATLGVLDNIYIQLYDPSNANVYATGVAAAANASGVFNHVAVCKSGLTYTFFINGTACGSTTRGAQPANSSDPFTIGMAHAVDYSYPFTGYIDDFRICNSVLYTGAFTPPIAQLSLLTRYGLNGLVFDNVFPV